MTGQQIKWASQHDWFHNANGDVVYVLSQEQDRFGVWHKEIKAFNDFKELRAWAGY